MPFWPPASPYAVIILEELRAALAPELVDSVLRDAVEPTLEPDDAAAMLLFADTRLRTALRARVRGATADVVAERVRDALLPIAAQYSREPSQEITARPAGPAGARVRVAVFHTEPQLRETLAAGLEMLGFETEVFASITSLLPALTVQWIDAVVVPAELSAADARALSDWLEGSPGACPVIVWPSGDRGRRATWGGAIAGAHVLPSADLGDLAAAVMNLPHVRPRAAQSR
jgi:hypothetical protein